MDRPHQPTEHAWHLHLFQNTATLVIPLALQARATRIAISPRLAIKI